jgi:hypothetical protein
MRLMRGDSLLTEHMAKTTCDWCKKEMDGGFLVPNDTVLPNVKAKPLRNRYKIAKWGKLLFKLKVSKF